MAKNLSQWDRGAGFYKVRENWLNRSFGTGKDLEVRIPGKQAKRGTFRTIDDTGCLVLEDTSGELSVISTADIFFQNVAEQEQ